MGAHKKSCEASFFSLEAARKSNYMTESCCLADAAGNEKNTLCQNKNKGHRVKIRLLAVSRFQIRIKAGSY